MKNEMSSMNLQVESVDPISEKERETQTRGVVSADSMTMELVLWKSTLF